MKIQKAILTPIQNLKLPAKGFKLKMLKRPDSTFLLVGHPSLISLIFHTLSFVVIGLMFSVFVVSCIAIAYLESVLLLSFILLMNILLGIKVYFILNRMIIWARTAMGDSRKEQLI